MEGISEVGGIRLRYRIDGDGPWLALVHGVGNRLEVWDGVIAALGAGWRILRYDMRGHGLSDKPEGPYTLADFVADLDGLLAAHRIERCHLAGFSLGGLVAQGMALAQGARLDRLILLSTVAGRTAQERARVATRLALVEAGDASVYFESSVARWYTDEFRARHPEIIAEQAARHRENDPKAYAAAYRVLAESDLAERLHEIRAPTLIATGEHDQGSNVRMARLMHERIEGSELVILPGLRHSVLIEAPERVAAMMGSFLRRRS